MSTAHLPEAPASVNIRFTLRGHDIQLTLRDTNEEELWGRMQRVLSKLVGEERPGLEPSAPHGEPGYMEEYPDPEEEPDDIPEPGEREDWCARHHVAMRKNDKGYFHQMLSATGKKFCNGHWCDTHQRSFYKNEGARGTWYSHRLEDGTYCNERPVAQRQPGEEG